VSQAFLRMHTIQLYRVNSKKKEKDVIDTDTQKTKILTNVIYVGPSRKLLWRESGWVNKMLVVE